MFPQGSLGSTGWYTREELTVDICLLCIPTYYVRLMLVAVCIAYWDGRIRLPHSPPVDCNFGWRVQFRVLVF